MLEDLTESRYLMTAYATASDSWEDFRGTGNKSALFEVAAILCGGWTTLSDDDDFIYGLDQLTEGRWATDLRSALHGRFPNAVGEGRLELVEEVMSYRATDKLLSQEMVVLVQAGMDPVHAVRLVTDLSELLTSEVRPPDSAVIAGLKANIPELASELCKAQQLLRTFDYDPLTETEVESRPPRRWTRSLRTLGIALKATAGAAGAVGNVVAAVGSFGVLTGFGLVSVVAGAEAMASAASSALTLRPDHVGDEGSQSARAARATGPKRAAKTAARRGSRAT
jgi:hypothetical protein